MPKKYQYDSVLFPDNNSLDSLFRPLHHSYIPSVLEEYESIRRMACRGLENFSTTLPGLEKAQNLARLGLPEGYEAIFNQNASLNSMSLPTYCSAGLDLQSFKSITDSNRGLDAITRLEQGARAAISLHEKLRLDAYSSAYSAVEDAFLKNQNLYNKINNIIPRNLNALYEYQKNLYNFDWINQTLKITQAYALLSKHKLSQDSILDACDFIKAEIYNINIDDFYDDLHKLDIEKKFYYKELICRILNNIKKNFKKETFAYGAELILKNILIPLLVSIAGAYIYDHSSSHAETDKSLYPKNEVHREIVKDAREGLSKYKNLLDIRIVKVNSHLNVRRFPQKKFHIVGILYPNTIIIVEEIKKKWCLISYKDQLTGKTISGWVFSKYLTKIR